MLVGEQRPRMDLGMQHARIMYPVVWALNDGDPITGTLEIAGGDIRLTGHTDAGTMASSRIAAAELFRVREGGGQGDRVTGLPTVAVDERGGRRFLIAPQAGGEQLREVAGLLQAAAGLAGSAVTRVLVRVPVDAEEAVHVRELIRRGPPYELEGMPGLERHEVYVTDRDVLFFFEGTDPGFAIERIVRDARVWSALESWDAYVMGPPSVVEADYTWTRRL